MAQKGSSVVSRTGLMTRRKLKSDEYMYILGRVSDAMIRMY